MSKIKCIGCGQLKREQDIKALTSPLVIYGCTRFPYWCALSGLLHPSKGVEKAAAECPVDISLGCIVCGKNPSGLYHYGENPTIAYVCPTHDRAWGHWLNMHPEKREYFKPRSRVITARWIEVFREWVEEARKK
jgi:hypothetical protein